MKSGMIAAQSIFENIDKNDEILEYESSIKKSWLWKELYKVRNIRPSLNGVSGKQYFIVLLILIFFVEMHLGQLITMELIMKVLVTNMIIKK